MIREALRSLRAAPGTTAFILLVLTLTISAATVTFSVVDAVVLRPLPFDHTEDLVVVEHHREEGVGPVRSLSAIQFLALSEGGGPVSAFAAVHRGSVTLQGGGESEQVMSARVTASLFEVLRARPLYGTTFTAANETAGNERVAVIGHSLWRRRFGADPAIVGRTISVADAPLVVLGVMPEGFTYPIVDSRVAEIWTPYVIPPDERSRTQQSSYLHVVGRLTPGASVTQGQAHLDAVRTRLATEEPDRYRTSRFVARPLKDAVVGPVRGWMVLVLSAVGLLLIVACANVANVLLTRAIVRARELSIRAALGATRARLVTSLLTESLFLSLCAVALGLLVASWGVNVAKSALPTGIARAGAIALDLRVFLTAVAAAIVTGLLFGVVPALQASRGDLVLQLKQGTAGSTGVRSRWRASVLVFQIALVSVLVVATTLFVFSFIRLTRADLGFDRSNLLLATETQGLQGTAEEVSARLQTIPGVVAVGGSAAGSPPLVMAGFGGGASGTRLRVPDPPDAEYVVVEFTRASPGYFAAAGIPLLRGRVFRDSDPPTFGQVVVDEFAATRLFGDRDPIGREVARGTDRITVIGVVANVRMRGPEEQSGPQAYFRGPLAGGSYAWLIRTADRPAPLIPPIQATLAAMRPHGSAPALVRPIEDAFRNISARRRFSAGTMGIFGLLALLIGAVGVYGVMSAVVAQGTREIGIRLALGASGRQIVGAVLAQMGRYVALGLMLGLPIAWVVSRGFASLFFGVRPSEAWVYVVVGSVLAVVGLAAALLPARRASLVDPLVALRTE